MSSPPSDPLKMIEVVWVDSMVLNDGMWDRREEYEKALEPKNMKHYSCGFLYAENDDALLLAGSYYPPTGAACSVALIPKVAIICITELVLEEGGE